MSQIKIQVLDRQAQRSEREVTTGTTAGDLFHGDRDVVVARVNGQLRDLAWALSDGDAATLKANPNLVLSSYLGEQAAEGGQGGAAQV